MAEEKKKVSAIQSADVKVKGMQYFYFKSAVSSLEDSWIYNIPMNLVPTVMVTSVSLITICGKLDSILLNVIKFISVLWQVSSFLLVFQFAPSIKIT